jgi:hypothetical protein
MPHTQNTPENAQNNGRNNHKPRFDQFIRFRDDPYDPGVQISSPEVFLEVAGPGCPILGPVQLH